MKDQQPLIKDKKIERLALYFFICRWVYSAGLSSALLAADSLIKVCNSPC
jgi:hypothetical protein